MNPNSVIFFVCNVIVKILNVLNFGFMAIIRLLKLGPRYVITISTH